MANTTNFGWETPDDTDLVKDGAAAIRTLGSAIDTSLVDLKGGTTGQILSKATNTDMDFTWITNDVGDITEVTASAPLTGGGSSGSITVGIQDGTTAQKGAVQLENSTSSTSTTTAAVPASVKSAYDLADGAIAKSIVDAKGDIIAATAADTVGRLAVGANNTVLTADSSTSTGLKWVSPASGALTLISTSTFSAVSSQTMDDVFSSTYDNYLIKVNCTASIQNTLGYYLRASGSDTTTNYQRQLIIGNGTTISGERAADNGIGALNSGGKNFTSIQIFDPNKANYTGLISSSIREDSSNIGEFLWTSYQKDSTAFTGIKFLTGVGTMTGSISIYGLAK